MSKIVFFDIDGTLLRHDKTIPDATKEAIQQLKKQDVYVAIATGRAPFMYEDLRKELEVDSFVSFNGQYVVFEGEPIYKNPLDRLAIKELTQKATDLGHPLVYLNHQTMKASIQQHDFISKAMGSLHMSHPEKDEAFFLNREIYQALIFCTEEWQSQYAEEFEQLHFIRWHELSMDVIPKGGSKAEGIKKMIEKLGFDLKDTYAFGDGLNDIEMIESVGVGVAMGNAVDEVKQHADYITKDVDEEGLVYGLKAVGLL
ncbi:Cof-type HAD-IIB family hydrolase [Bacillus carboniphilus]|uniref:Cof-type HAD-IIB family hydrolase n=1 Tax=Bacillus carboniphilus TaxID=86663 RepID=A0ABP3FWP2_9BACI